MIMINIMDIERLISDTVSTDWKDVLLTIVKPFKVNINTDMKQYDRTIVMPSYNNMFRCFNYFNVKDTKVIILGQDPYHTLDVADGLCFSTSKERLPPSLINVFKELMRTHHVMRKDGNLEDWAKQGVLLMNTSLSVLINKPNSHSKIWKPFTNAILEWISDNITCACIMLWGNDAKKSGSVLCNTENMILTHTHPSPLSRKPFTGCNHFIECDRYLEEKGRDKIEWIV